MEYNEDQLNNLYTAIIWQKGLSHSLLINESSNHPLYAKSGYNNMLFLIFLWGYNNMPDIREKYPDIFDTTHPDSNIIIVNGKYSVYPGSEDIVGDYVYDISNKDIASILIYMLKTENSDEEYKIKNKGDMENISYKFENKNEFIKYLYEALV